jgi:hypothetical protein
MCDACKRPYNQTLRLPIVTSCCGDTLCKECWHKGFNPRSGNVFYCPFKCKRPDTENQKHPKYNLAIKRLVDANLPVDIVCDKHSKTSVCSYSLSEKRLICPKCPHSGLNMDLDGRAISDACKLLRDNLQIRFDDVRMCIETLDELLGGKGPMTSVNVLHLLKRSFNLISDMLKTSREREPLFFLKDIKTVVVDDFEQGSVRSSTKSFALANHTRSHSAAHDHHAITMREDVKSTLSS